jgi:dolichyl-phosphate-mannose--protein O-mannosyl transferase
MLVSAAAGTVDIVKRKAKPLIAGYARFLAFLGGSKPGQFLVKWFWTILITVFAGFLRLIHLGHPHALVFDETYYVKDGWSLIKHAVELQWPDNPNPDFVSGKTNIMGPGAEYVVHPPIGKWLIGIGEWLFGIDNSFSWRFATAIAGTATVFLMILVGKRLMHSQVLGCVAGLLLAVDGEAIVMSRTGILDGFIGCFALLGFWFVLKDRDQMKARLRERCMAVVGHGPTGVPVYQSLRWGPKLGMRWYLLGAGVALGLCTAVKWSGLYFIAVFGILVAAWDMADRKAAGIKYWWAAGFLKDATKAFCLIVLVAVAVYLASWSGWFATSDGWDRQWADTHPAHGLGKLFPNALRSLLYYHSQAYEFHTHLTTPHDYQSNPLLWLFQQRPTSFYWENVTKVLPAAEQKKCGSTGCFQAITSLGNPIIWWAGILGLLVVLFFAVFWADRRAWAILAGYIGGYVPWLFFMKRTIFTFYTVAFVPFVVLAVVFALGVLIGPRGTSAKRRKVGLIVAGVVVVLAMAMAAFFWPIWTGETVHYNFWYAHMWFNSWI